MNEELKNILIHLNPDIDQELIMQYLQGKLSTSQQQELEEKMQTDAFTMDAMDGLQEFNNSHKVEALVEQLNRELKKKTARKQKEKRKHLLELDPLSILAIVIILALAVISFVLIHSSMKK